METRCTPCIVALVLIGVLCLGVRIQAHRNQASTGQSNQTVDHAWAPETVALRGQIVTPFPADMLELTRLPAETRQVLSVILLVPLGALVTCVFVNMIGIETSGRFTPMLLALSFVFADWRAALIILAVIVLLGLASRDYLERLNLLVLPRLSVTVTLVVCAMVFGVSALNYYHLTSGVYVVLLPMVILTMVIERCYVSGQEDGAVAAAWRLLGTLVVGLCCYAVFRWQAAGDLLLAYPELHLFTVAALILIGRYTGYQLTEWWRFRDMVISRDR